MRFKNGIVVFLSLWSLCNSLEVSLNGLNTSPQRTTFVDDEDDDDGERRVRRLPLL
ncbi:Hypothetical protein CINCED_3A007770 [Cinara cedri]|uniref:Uncharacterized protein n=1 Tax=Cinara cedri TaxID=506608 RepID=A0A5E4NC77_9HEMI|nr:Hypothetical protein CINCED_3A007770 [Cinara cedri]